MFVIFRNSMAWSIWIFVHALVGSMDLCVSACDPPITEKEILHSCFLPYPPSLTKGVLGIMVKSVYHEVYRRSFIEVKSSRS